MFLISSKQSQPPLILIPTELAFRASNDLELFKKISYKTLQNIQDEHAFDQNPIYAILHEPLYCQGCDTH